MIRFQIESRICPGAILRGAHGTMVRAVLWSLQRAIKILLSRTPFALPHPNLPRKEGGTKNAVFIAAWLAEFQNCTDYCLIPIAVKSLNMSDETRAEREAKETCCGRWTEIQFFPGFQGIGRSTSEKGNKEGGPAISLAGPFFLPVPPRLEHLTEKDTLTPPCARPSPIKVEGQNHTTLFRQML